MATRSKAIAARHAQSGPARLSTPRERRLSVPHLNRMMQQLRAEGLINGRSREVGLSDMASLQTLAQYQPLDPAPIPLPVKDA